MSVTRTSVGARSGESASERRRAGRANQATPRAAALARNFHDRCAAMKNWSMVLLLASACATVDDVDELERQGKGFANARPFKNALGTSGTWSTAGSVEVDGPFFEELGTNG